MIDGPALRYGAASVQGGNNTKGTTLHSLLDATGGGIRLVEKHSDRRIEHTFYRKFYFPAVASGLRLPQLMYLGDFVDGTFAVVTQYVEGVGEKPSLDGVDTAALGGYLARIGQLQADNLQTHSHAKPLDEKLLNDLGRLPDLADLGREFRKLAPLLPRLQELLASLPMVTCHNDLYWHNMAVPNQNASSSPYILDWGSFGLNYIGADLVMFACRYLKAHYQKVQLLLHAYAMEMRAKTGLQIDEKAVMVAAQNFGFKRAAFQYVAMGGDDRKRELRRVVSALRQTLS